jgi:hypothetical protein
MANTSFTFIMDSFIGTPTAPFDSVRPNMRMFPDRVEYLGPG